MKFMDSIKLDEVQGRIIDYCLDRNMGNTYIDGGAGTGKTTLIRELIKQLPPKSTAVVAPKGKAAMNIGGYAQTIHRMFNMDTCLLPLNYRSRDIDRDMIESLQCLIIDEISMVRSDVLNAIDSILKYFKWSNEPFGGVKVIMVGDFGQLPPVVKNAESHSLTYHHGGVFCFLSKAWKSADIKIFKLTQCYRQKDKEFIHHLNRLRMPTNIRKVQGSVRWINDHASIQQDHNSSFYICTTRSCAAVANTRMLSLCTRGPYELFTAQINGPIDQSDYPAEKEFYLRSGCQVRLLKNKYDPKTGQIIYVNGQTGELISNPNLELIVRLSNGKVIRVEKEHWEFYGYTQVKTGEHICFDKYHKASFCQVPLALNFAGTIHSLQGSGLPRAHLQVGPFWEPGQAYTALSRVESIDGLSICRELHTDDFNRWAPSLKRFYEYIASVAT